MRICMIGKFPPIEGGVSMHQYWYAHSLASLGHQVHVVTNAREVEPRFRMLMRPKDWLRCEGQYPNGGYVRVHWTDPFDHRQRHIPGHNPFVTKLTSLAAQVVREFDLDVIFSYYLEPYGVAGYLAGQMTGRPHVVKHAGSDAARLRLHPQFGPLYDHIFRCATRIVTAGSVAEQLRAAGVEEEKFFRRDDFKLPASLFCPDGDALDLEKLLADVSADAELAVTLNGQPVPEPPFLGVYGKLGEAKGTFDLLRALQCLKQQGHKLHLLVVGHGWGRSEAKFQKAVRDLGLGECVTQLPFLPHWRIPEFIRLCQATCFLEREFPIASHMPTVPREVFACGRCLVGSAEVLRRQLLAERLIHGFNCLAIRDVRNTEEMSSTIAAILQEPERARQVGHRGHRYSLDAESLRTFPENYEALFREVIGEHGSVVGVKTSRQHADEFAWTRRIIESLSHCKPEDVTPFAGRHGDRAAWALAAYVRLLERVDAGELDRDLAIEAVRVELQLAGALAGNPEVGAGREEHCGLFRLDLDDARRAALDRELFALCPIGVSGATLQEYQYDIRALLAARRAGEFPTKVHKGTSWAALVPGLRGGRCRIFPLSPVELRLLDLCDGSRTIEELAREIQGDFEGATDLRGRIAELIIEYFRQGLLRLTRRTVRDRRPTGQGCAVSQ